MSAIRRVPVIGVAEAGKWVEAPVSIPLSRGLSALVDAADAPLINQHRWYAIPRSNGSGFYAVRNDAGRRLWMHRVIMQPAPGLVVDHINGDGLDNRRSANLRVCTTRQNNLNRRTAATWRGVKALKVGFQAVLHQPDGQIARQGPFDTATEAARAYDAMAYAARGDFAVLNFPVSELPPADDRLSLIDTAATVGIAAETLRKKWRLLAVNRGFPVPHRLAGQPGAPFVWRRTALETWLLRLRSA